DVGDPKDHAQRPRHGLATITDPGGAHHRDPRDAVPLHRGNHMRGGLRKQCRWRHNRREGIASTTQAQAERSHDRVFALDRHIDECSVERTAANDINAMGHTSARALAHDRGWVMPSLHSEPYEPLSGRAVGAEYDQFHRPFNAHDGNSIFLCTGSRIFTSKRFTRHSWMRLISL